MQHLITCAGVFLCWELVTQQTLWHRKLSGVLMTAAFLSYDAASVTLRLDAAELPFMLWSPPECFLLRRVKMSDVQPNAALSMTAIHSSDCNHSWLLTVNRTNCSSFHFLTRPTDFPLWSNSTNSSNTHSEAEVRFLNHHPDSLLHTDLLANIHFSNYSYRDDSWCLPVN